MTPDTPFRCEARVLLQPIDAGSLVRHELEIPAAVKWRDLIRTRVREELAKANAAIGEGRKFRTLVQPTEAEATLNGYRLRKGRTIDWRRQADEAETAFARNGFFVLVEWPPGRRSRRGAGADGRF